MAILSILPPAVSSASELLSMAEAMEKEAARRYRVLSARMRLRHEDRLARLFTFLSEIEEKHAGKIERDAEQVLHRPLPPVAPGWEIPETFSEEEAASHLLTPHRALALAVRNEDRAFAFYSYIAAEAPDELTRKLAEDLAKEELEHARLLRQERRAAYRTEKPRTKVGPGVPGTLHDLWTLAAQAENRAAEYHRALAAALAPEDERMAALFTQTANDEADCAREASARAGSIASDLRETKAPTVQDALGLLEESFERYLDVAERAKDEEVVREAQSLAERALERLSMVYGSIAFDTSGAPNES